MTWFVRVESGGAEVTLMAANEYKFWRRDVVGWILRVRRERIECLLRVEWRGLLGLTIL